MSIVFKFVLSLGVLLLGGSVLLSANTYSLAKNRSEHSCTAAAKRNNEAFTVVSSGKERQSHAVDQFFFENEEDDKLISFKKRLSGKYIVDIWFNQTSGELLRFPKITLPYQHFPYSASSRYLIIQVFRI